MPLTAQTQTNFTAGELSPRVFGRTDLARYKNGVKTLENFLPMRQGGVVRRPGFRFTEEVKDSSKATRLIPFEFNAEQTYILEFGGKDGSTATISGASATDNYFEVDTDNLTGTFLPSRRFTVSGSTGNDGEYSVIASEFITGTPDKTRIYVTDVTDTSTGTITPHIGYVRFYRDEAQLDSVTDVPTEIDSPYDEADLFNIKHVQSNDVLFMVHPDYPPQKLTRSAGDDTQDATWSIAALDPKDGPYLDQNITATTLTTNAAPATTLEASTTLFGPSDVGRVVRIDSGAEAAWFTITNYNVTTGVVTVTQEDESANLAIGDVGLLWKLGAWSATTGFPATIGFFEERLWFGATAAEPNTLYSTTLGSIDTFTPGTLDTDEAIIYTHGIVAQLASEQLNTIRWLVSDTRGLIILTDGGVWTLVGISEQLGPSDPGAGSTQQFGFAARRQNADPTSPLVQPWKAGKVVLMLEKGERRLLQELFTFQDDRFIGTDMTVLADHVNVGGVVESALQVRPELRLWLARTDGQLICMTLDIDQQVVAWSRHITLGGDGGVVGGVVESIATIRQAGEDQLWAVIRRTIGGSTKRYVEFLEEPFDVNTRQDLAFYVDSGLSLGLTGAAETYAITGISRTNPARVTSVAHGVSDGASVRIRSVKGMTEVNDLTFTAGNVQTDSFTLVGIDATTYSAYSSGGYANVEVESISGLSHLEGQTVNVMVDGASHPPQVVVAGAITLDAAASRVHVGLPIESLMTTMPVVATTEGHDSRSGLMQISQMYLIVDRSMGGMVGAEGAGYNEIIYREGVDSMGAAPPLFTGFLDTEF